MAGSLTVEFSAHVTLHPDHQLEIDDMSERGDTMRGKLSLKSGFANNHLRVALFMHH
jgi:hypothetical protein